MSVHGGRQGSGFQRVKPALEAMGTTVLHCGGPGTGTRSKLVNNFLAIASCQLNAECMALIQGFGLDLETSLEVIHGTSATNGQLKMNYATKVLIGDVEPGFAIDLAHKDLSLIMESANKGRVPMPMAAAAVRALAKPVRRVGAVWISRALQTSGARERGWRSLGSKSKAKPGSDQFTSSPPSASSTYRSG